MTPIFDIPEKGGQPWVDGHTALLFFVARNLQTGMRSQTLFGLEGLQGCGKTLLLKYIECILLGPNCARYVKALAALILKEFFQEHQNTTAIVTDEIDQSVFNSNEFKALCDDKTGQAQLKHVNGVERFESFFTIFAAWNPLQNFDETKKVLAMVKERGRRIVACAVSAVLVSCGKGRKPGGAAAALYILKTLSNQFNPWINAGVLNFLMTGIVAGPGFNLQQFGGDSPEEVARLRSLLLYSDLTLWDQFINFFAALPEAQKPAPGSDVTTYETDKNVNTNGLHHTKMSDESLTKLAVVKHGLFQNKSGCLNYAFNSKDDGLNLAIFNGIEEHAVFNTGGRTESPSLTTS